MKKLFIALLLLCLAATPIASQQLPAIKIDLPKAGLNYLYLIDEGVYRSEQPTRTDFRAMERYGIREVLNLRKDHNDKKDAAGTALALHRIKAGTEPNIKQIIEALRIIKNRKGPIVMHGQRGFDRTGAVTAVYRMVFQDIAKEDAVKEMKAGFGDTYTYSDKVLRTVRLVEVHEIRRTLGLRKQPDGSWR